MPLRHQHLHRRKIDHLALIRLLRKHAPVSCHNRHEKQHPCQIPEEAHHPADGQILDADPPVQECRQHEHDVGGEEVGAAKHDHHEADGEEDGADGADETGGVLLIPGRCFGGEEDSAAGLERRGQRNGLELGIRGEGGCGRK